VAYALAGFRAPPAPLTRSTREPARMIADDGYQPEIILIPLVDDKK
jgi:hypothetical protein